MVALEAGLGPAGGREELQQALARFVGFVFVDDHAVEAFAEGRAALPVHLQVPPHVPAVKVPKPILAGKASCLR